MDARIRQEVVEFLRSGTRTGKVGYSDSTGRALVAPVWYILYRDSIVFVTGKGSAKGRSIVRDPRVSVLVDSEKPPYGFVQIQGIAEWSDDPDELLEFATLIAARYMGQEMAEHFGRRNGVLGEMVVHLRPVKVIADFATTAPKREGRVYVWRDESTPTATLRSPWQNDR